MKVVDHLERVLVRLYHASAGMQRWYWAEILKGLALIDDHRGPKTIKPNQVTLCLSTLVIVCMIVRSCLIIAFLDRLDREQRLLLFTEQFPATVRKHIEILVLAWSIFYLAIVLGLDFGRTTGEQWACLEILIIGGEHKETLTQQEWTQFEKFRTRLVQLVGVFVSNLAIITALILVLLSMHSGTFALSPLLTTAYHVFIILWVSVVCYPIYPLMSVLILWARHHAMLQRASQRWMQRIARGNNFDFLLLINKLINNPPQRQTHPNMAIVPLVRVLQSSQRGPCPSRSRLLPVLSEHPVVCVLGVVGVHALRHLHQADSTSGRAVPLPHAAGGQHCVDDRHSARLFAHSSSPSHSPPPARSSSRPSAQVGAQCAQPKSSIIILAGALPVTAHRLQPLERSARAHLRLAHLLLLRLAAVSVDFQYITSNDPNRLSFLFIVSTNWYNVT